MNNYFIWADPHINHKNVILHCMREPWLYPNPDYNPMLPKHFKFNNEWAVNLKSHDDDIIDNHNQLVKRGDTVIILGDFAWRDHNKYLARLNGKHIMILGNHDKMNQDVLRNFSEVHEMGCRKKINGWDITFSHYAMRSWPSSCHNSVHCWAHSHGRMPEFDNMLACDGGVDIWGYGVLPIDVFFKKMQMKIDWIKENGKYAVDGENRAEGQYDRNPDQRVIDVRKKNKEIMRSMGYPINEKMWPTEVLKWPKAAQ